MSHADLVRIAERWLRNTWKCGVVLVERGYEEIPDAIGWTSHGISTLIECKVSYADWLRDKSKPWRVVGGMGANRFYLTPKGLLQPSEVEDGWGLLETTGRRVRVVRPCVPSFVGPDCAAEVRLLASELRRYQLHGITYPPLTVRATGGEQ